MTVREYLNEIRNPRYDWLRESEHVVCLLCVIEAFEDELSLDRERLSRVLDMKLKRGGMPR